MCDNPASLLTTWPVYTLIGPYRCENNLCTSWITQINHPFLKFTKVNNQHFYGQFRTKNILLSNSLASFFYTWPVLSLNLRTFILFFKISKCVITCQKLWTLILTLLLYKTCFFFISNPQVSCVCLYQAFFRHIRVLDLFLHYKTLTAGDHQTLSLYTSGTRFTFSLVDCSKLQ